MDESESKGEKPKEKRRLDPELLKKGLRCDLDQYEMLKRCSDKKDMTEWNRWRSNNPNAEVFLEFAGFAGAHLEGVNLCGAHMERASLLNVNLKGADLRFSYFDGAILECAKMDGANLSGAHLEDADLRGALIRGGGLVDTHLKNASMSRCHLEDAFLGNANLERTNLTGANLKGAEFDHTSLEGASFVNAIVDGHTLFVECELDRKTDFRRVGLDSARIGPATKQLLEYNARRMNWEEWYPKQHRLLARLVRKFWEISDYGISTKQIIKTFFAWALMFAAVYLAWGLIDYHLVGLKDNPGIVSNLFVLEGEQETVSPWLVPFRSVYFSIVTMTTLGFGDMYANTNSFLRGLFGHALLAIQVILGYVLLGALVTRFAVLFTAGGPAGEFADEKRKPKRTQRKE